MHTHTITLGEITTGVPPQGAKTCFVLCYQGNAAFGHLSCTVYDHFEATDVNRFPHVYTGEKFSNFCAGNFPCPKNSPKYGTLGWGVCDRAAAQTAQMRAMGIISWASRHPNDVPFVREFWWGTYGLGAISPKKAEILPNLVRELTLSCNCRPK